MIGKQKVILGKVKTSINADSINVLQVVKSRNGLKIGNDRSVCHHIERLHSITVSEFAVCAKIL